ncbi:unnamed protein product [Ambrosiozyma monospora]|uniref:Unnamed protein product n=1 Tax=Ambrosiozyma monospora TaxID=43982 RepID=A0A9W6YSV1_AMBMO|nr:unnamed protein product [Ambrosiozyma monospora]
MADLQDTGVYQASSATTSPSPLHDQETLENTPQQQPKSPRARVTTAQHRRTLTRLNELNDLSDIEKAIRNVFQEAQKQVGTHKRQTAVLNTIQKRCFELGISNKFNDIFCGMVNRVLDKKKGYSPADRIVKFIASFIKVITVEEKDEDDDEEEDDDDEEQPDDFKMFNGFVTHLIHHLQKGFESVNKNVRIRSCELLSFVMHSTSSLDAALYDKLFADLDKRSSDSDMTVRKYAIACLAGFQNEDFETNTSRAGKKIRFIMQNDTSAEVRKSCLNQVEKTIHTNIYIFERAKDTSDTVRKLLFEKILPKYKVQDIPFQAKEKLLTYGLKDRVDAVREVAIKWLTVSWYQDCENNITKLLQELNVLHSEIAETAVKTFLETMDIEDMKTRFQFTEDHIENLTPEHALLIRVFHEFCIDKGVIDSVNTLFPDIPDLASLIKKFFDERRSLQYLYHLYNNGLPNVDGEYICKDDLYDETYYDFIIVQLLKIACGYDYSDDFGRGQMLATLKVILREDTWLSESIAQYLLACLRKLTINERDFTQVIIVEIINDMVHPETLENTNDLVNTQSNPVGNSHTDDGLLGENEEEEEDNDDDEDVDDFNPELLASMTPEELLRHSELEKAKRMVREKENAQKQEEDHVLKMGAAQLASALIIVKRMLELVEESLAGNQFVSSLLDSLISPAVKRRESEIRLLAVSCMGLCCMLDEKLAKSNLYLFHVISTKSDSEKLKIAGLKIISDLLTAHGSSIMSEEASRQSDVDSMVVDVNQTVCAFDISKLFYAALNSYESPQLQVIACEAIMKMFLCQSIDDDELFEAILINYFGSKIDQNEAMKQCLTFCIPAYAFSSVDHQGRLVRIVADTIFRIFEDRYLVYEELDKKRLIDQQSRKNKRKKEESDDLMIKREKPFKDTENGILDQIAEWTNPGNVCHKDDDASSCNPSHAKLALQLLSYCSRIHPTSGRKNFVKAVFRILPELSFGAAVGYETLNEIQKVLESDALFYGELSEALKFASCQKNYTKFLNYVKQCLSETSSQQEAAEETHDTTTDSTNTQQQDINATTYTSIVPVPTFEPVAEPDTASNGNNDDSDTDSLFNGTLQLQDTGTHESTQNPIPEESTIPDLSAPIPITVKEEEQVSHVPQSTVKQEYETVGQTQVKVEEGMVKRERKRSLFSPTPSPKKKQNIFGGSSTSGTGRLFQGNSSRKTRSTGKPHMESEIILISDSEPDDDEIIILD